jgi:hypothetical protein
MLIMMGLLAIVDMAIALSVGSGVLKWVLVALSFVLLGIGWVFSQLTVSVSDEHLVWHFGGGFWTKRLNRAEITCAKPVRCKWWYGWGIRLSPLGWLYNVSGLDAVAVTGSDGKTVLIGTDDPEVLSAALNS